MLEKVDFTFDASKRGPKIISEMMKMRGLKYENNDVNRNSAGVSVRRDDAFYHIHGEKVEEAMIFNFEEYLLEKTSENSMSDDELEDAWSRRFLVFA